MLFDLVEESLKLISLRSVSDEGTKEIVSYLTPFCRKLGFHATLQSPQISTTQELNLIAHTVPPNGGDLCPGGLALVTHLDTVPGGDPDLWTETGGDPFRGTVAGDRIYGLGSADTKLDFLCKLLAIERVGLKNVKIPLALIGTFGEEKSLAGARLLRETGLVKPKFALIGEPCELKAVVAHKGILYMRARFSGGVGAVREPPLQKTFRGKAAHGSMPHLGDNAVEKAMRWAVAQEKTEVLEIVGGTVHNVVPERCRVTNAKCSVPGLRTLFLKTFLKKMDEARTILAKEHNPAFDPPRTTDNIGVVRMADPDTIEIDFDFRLIPDTVTRILEELFASLVDEVPGASVEKIRSNPPLNTLPDTEIVRRVGEAQEAAGLPRAFVVKSGNTEGPIFSEMGAQAVIIGPGKAVGNIHAPNEHNEIPQLHKAVEFYAAFLRQFC